MALIYKAKEKKEKLIRKQNGLCALCNNPISLKGKGDLAPSLDHIIPKSQGGWATYKNLRLVHRICNSVRGNMDDKRFQEILKEIKGEYSDVQKES